MHLHSTHSDGTGTVDQIVAAGQKSGVDAILLTDHDTLAGKSQEGWHGNVLLLVGEEVSPERRNHYLAFGLDETIDHGGLDSAGLVGAGEQAGGLRLAAPPVSQGGGRVAPAGAR